MCSRKRSAPGIAVGEHHEGSFGVYMQHKISKLQRQNQASYLEQGGVDSSIFEGVVAYVDGLTDPPILELRRLLYVHGGALESYQVPSVTHIICDYLPDSKIKELRKKKRHLPHVTAKWVVDSVAQGKKLPIADYLIPGLKNQHGGMIADAIRASPSVSASTIAATTIAATTAASSSVAAVPAVQTFQSRSSTEPASPVETVSSSRLVPDAVGDTVEDAVDGESDDQGSAGSEVDEFEEGMRPGKRIRSTKCDPDFMQNYFSSSRLHFIGSWKARFQELAPILRAQSHQTQQDFQRIMQSTDFQRRVVLHVDMDCFFVSVLLRNRPELKGKPVGVAHSGSIQGNGSSEVSSCNYEARQFGVRNGMFMGAAKALCPDLVVLSYDFEQYQQVSEEIYRIFYRHAPVVQPVSIDEVFLELTPETDGMEVATTIRREIFEATKCPASAGVSYNMLLARLATRKAKPNGQYKIALEHAKEELRTLDIDDLPGVGWRLNKKMHEHGIQHVSDLWQYRKGQLQDMFGQKTGEQLFLFSRGEDRRKLQPAAARKSVGVDVNWGVRFTEQEEVKEFLRKLSGELQQRLEEIGYRGRTLTLKIKHKVPGWVEPVKFLGHGPCENYSKSVTFASSTTAADTIHRESFRLYQELNFAADMIVGVGLQMTKLEPLDAQSGSAVAPSNGLGSISRWLVPNANQESHSPTKRADRDAPDGPSQLVQHDPPHDAPAEQAAANGIIAQKQGEWIGRNQRHQESFSDNEDLDDPQSDFELELPLQQPAPQAQEQQPAAARPIAEELTFSQIDPAVLAELPASIVEELEHDLRRRRQNGDPVATTAPRTSSPRIALPPPSPPPPPPAPRSPSRARTAAPELPALNLPSVEAQIPGKRGRQLSMEAFKRLWKVKEEESLRLTGLSQPVSAEVLDELPLAVRLEILGLKPSRDLRASHSHQPTARSAAAPPARSKTSRPSTIKSAEARQSHSKNVQEEPAPQPVATVVDTDGKVQSSTQETLLPLDALFSREPPSEIASALSSWIDAIGVPEPMHRVVNDMANGGDEALMRNHARCLIDHVCRTLRRLCAKNHRADERFAELNNDLGDAAGLPACVVKAAQLFLQRNADSPSTPFRNMCEAVESAAQLEFKRLYGYALHI